MYKSCWTSIVLLAAGVLLFLCSPSYYTYSPFYQKVTEGRAVITPTKGNSVTGTVTFQQVPEGIAVTADINGLTPGEHGFHIHEFGHCACDDAVCAGQHFNPTNKPHGGRDDKERHIGDFGNLVADAQGNAQLSFVDTQLSLNGPNSIIGRSVIIHADKDDLVSQPSGNSGSRIGCGVVGISALRATKP